MNFTVSEWVWFGIVVANVVAALIVILVLQRKGRKQ